MAQILPNIRSAKNYRARQDSSMLNSDQYHLLYRFSQENVQWIANYFLGNGTETRGGALTPLQKMEVTLRYFANPGFQSGVAREIGVHKTTISKTIFSTVEKIVDKAGEWIKFPETYEEINRAKFEWRNTRGFPCTIGAIDCTHIRIEKSSSFADEYINRKGFPSINVQATVNEKGKSLL
jgi:nuclease HARBI1